MVKNIVKLGLVLFLICGISTGLLSFVNSLTAPVILENAKNQELLANKEVLPEASEFSIVAEDISEGKDNLGNVVGYAVKVSPNGYGGKINMIVGVTCDYTVSGVEILSMSETLICFCFSHFLIYFQTISILLLQILKLAKI